MPGRGVFALALGCLFSISSGAQTVPLSYNAITDTVARPKPPLPALGPAGSVIVDPTFKSRILRVTDPNTVPTDTNQSYHTPSGGFITNWNSNTTLFAVEFRGLMIPFKFDPVTFKATRIPDPSGNTADGGLLLWFNPEGVFSYRQPNLYYGMSALNLKQYDFNTNQYTTLFTATRAVPSATGGNSSLSVSDDDTKFAFAFGGGGTQNSWANVVVWNRSTGTYTLLDTRASTVDGRPTNIPLGFGVHSCYIDRSGRWVTIGTSGGIHDWIVWDTQTGNLGWITQAWSGHDVSGFGVRINQDGYFGGPGFYEAVDFVKRSLDLSALNTATLLVAPAGLPLPHSGSPGVHMSWNNAQPAAMVPMVAATYRDYVTNTEPWRAWDDEVIGVATDGTSRVWRFCHTRSLWTSSDFWATPRPNVSQNGRYAMFTSNWEKTLGTDAAVGGPRQDVFIVELAAGAAAPPPADSTAPSVSITAPLVNQTLSGTVAVQASASDNVGIAGVQFQCDGYNLGQEVTTAPYKVSWDTTKSTSGAHTLSAIARDAAGNQTRSAAVAVSVLNPTVPPAVNTIRVNAGGGAYTDSLGRVWSADTGFAGGALYTNGTAVRNTPDPTLYQTERYGVMAYNFVVPAGTYNVTLKFAEIWFTQAGKRMFNVVLNGQVVLSNFDIFAQAGGAQIALDKKFTTTSTGRITIQFVPVVENPKINAIEIVPASGNSISVAVTPGTATLSASQTQQFAATVLGTANPAVAWSISPAAGNISATGLYTAPSTIASATSVTVNAVSVADGITTGRATVNLKPAVSVSVSPQSATLAPLQPRQFTAQVSGLTNTAVTWSMAPAIGTLSAAGLYTAPASFTPGQLVTITARSAADSTKSASATVTLFAPILVNSGGPQYWSPTDQIFGADTGFTGGQTYVTTMWIANTTMQTPYQTERYGGFSYQFAVPNGTRTVKLRFAEIRWASPRQRVFNVAINGALVLQNFDIVAQVGAANTALDKQFLVNVANRLIKIDFIPVVDNAKVSAIEIY